MNAEFGRYRLLERLGQGGMAEVFKAKSFGVEGFEKILVIKRILPELARRKDFVDMFIHEAKLSVRLSHANIVQVFDLGKAPMSEPSGAQAADGYYIAMEYVHGLDLASALARARRRKITLPVPLGVYVACEVLKGLDHAHRRRDEDLRPLGIVHRDVSPQNVLLSFEGEVKVTDFGIAKARGMLDRGVEDTRARKLQGKFAYMSPEQALGESVDARSDLFSVGTLLYECLTGTSPFAAPTTFETLRRVQACDYPPVELLQSDTPPQLAGILKTAMARVPADRFGDAGRMYEALLAFLYSQGARFGAHDLAELLARLRDAGDAGEGRTDVGPLLETERGRRGTDRTPIEVPSPRQASSSVRASAGLGSAAIDRAMDLGERREVTALVLELPRGTPPPVVDKAAGIVERWGGRVLRREAGHIAALFGLGDPDGRDTEMATRCALVALRGLDPLRPPAAGLHTGRIHVTTAGDPTADDRLGAIVDAARGLARVREGKAAISAAAMRQVEALFEFEAMNDGDRPPPNLAGVLVKGVRGPGDGFGRFVGRREELRRIGEVLASATKRTARVLTIRGDHGVGKTRLLYEVERRLRKGGYNVGFHVAACPPSGAGLPLSGIVCMLQVLCAVAEGDTQERIAAVQPRLRALGLQEDEVSSVLFALGATLPTAPGNQKTLLRHAFTRMVQSLCADRPHTFAWDVAHAMDEASFAMLQEVLRHLKPSRVVFLFAARAGFSHPFEGTDDHAALDLGDLAPADAERLVASRLGVDVVPEELLRFVRARAGGHPLFVEEVIKGLVEARAVTVGERRVVSLKLVGQDLALPKTLRGLVASRVARLSSKDRATLQAAAVLGDPIDLAVLAAVLGQAMPSLERLIATLRASELLVQTRPNEVRFASPLVPEIVADALTPEAAREMHAAAGHALQTTLGSRAWEQAGRIAGHLYEAGDRERAAGYFARSGERRLETRHFEAAASDYARAIALADPSLREPRELVGWLENLSCAVRLVRSLPDSVELCNRVVERADAAGGRDLRVRVRVAAGQLLGAVQHMESSRSCLAEAQAIAGDDQPLVKAVLIAESELAIIQGDFQRALAQLDALRGIVRSASAAAERHRVALHQAQAHAGVGDRATALASLDEAEQVLPQDRLAALERTKVRSLVDYFTRDFRSAALHAEKAIDMAREMGVGYEVMLNLHNLGDILVHMDDLPRAYGAIQQSLALCEEFGYERLANSNRMLLAFLDGIQGAADGDKLLRHGIAYAQSKDFTWDIIGGRILLAKLLQQGAHVQAARDEYETTRVLALAAGHRLVADDCDRALEALERADRGQPRAGSR